VTGGWVLGAGGLHRLVELIPQSNEKLSRLLRPSPRTRPPRRSRRDRFLIV
jgi:hypothetical protein